MFISVGLRQPSIKLQITANLCTNDSFSCWFLAIACAIALLVWVRANNSAAHTFTQPNRCIYAQYKHRYKLTHKHAYLHIYIYVCVLFFFGEAALKSIHRNIYTYMHTYEHTLTKFWKLPNTTILPLVLFFFFQRTVQTNLDCVGLSKYLIFIFFWCLLVRFDIRTYTNVMRDYLFVCMYVCMYMCISTCMYVNRHSNILIICMHTCTFKF